MTRGFISPKKQARKSTRMKPENVARERAILEMYLDHGVGQAEIARAVGLTRQRVHAIIHDAAERMGESYEDLRERHLVEATLFYLRAYINGYTTREIAAAMRRSECMARKRVQKGIYMAGADRDEVERKHKENLRLRRLGESPWPDAVKMHKEGRSIAEIAEAIGRHQSTVRARIPDLMEELEMEEAA